MPNVDNSNRVDELHHEIQQRLQEFGSLTGLVAGGHIISHFLDMENTRSQECFVQKRAVKMSEVAVC